MAIFILILKTTIGLLTVVFSKNKISEILQVIKATRRNEYIEKKASESNIIKNAVEELRHHYGVDRVILYFTHNGMRASNGYSFYKFSCLEESFDKKYYLPKKQDQQNMPIGLMMNFMMHYRKFGRLECNNIQDYNNLPEYDGKIEDLSFILESEKISSTWSDSFSDLYGNCTCFLVMNMEGSAKNIDNFEFFENTGKLIGSLLTEKK